MQSLDWGSLNDPGKRACECDYDVLAIDDKDENIQEIADTVTLAVRADVREPGILKSLGVQNVDVAIIAVAENMEASITATMQVKTWASRLFWRRQ